MSLGDFTITVKDWAGKTAQQAEDQGRKLALEAGRRVIQKTPVDTGRAKNSIFASANAIGSESAEPGDYDRTGASAIARLTAEINAMHHVQSIFIYSNLPYIRRLEYGWSKQAPQGMFRTTLVELGAVAS